MTPDDTGDPTVVHRTDGATASEPMAATGVARGGLGTGANLDDTQVLSSAELARAAAAVEQDRPHSATEGSAAAISHARAEAAAPAPSAAPTAAAAVGPAAPRPARPVDQRGRGLAGVLAAALAVLAGVALVVSQGGDPVDPALAAPTVLATEQPNGNAADPDREDRDKGKDCRGNGRGNGCGNGNGNGNSGRGGGSGGGEDDDD